MPYRVDIAERTLFDHIARLKRDRGEPRAAIKPGQEVNAADAIRRRGLELLERELGKLEAKAVQKPLTDADVRITARIVRESEDLKRRAEQPETAKTKKAREMKSGQTAAPSSRLAALAREMQREAVQTGAHTQDNGTGTAGSTRRERSSAPNNNSNGEH